MLRSLQASATHSTLTPSERDQAQIKFQLTQTLNHLLYTEWDPIGVHLLRSFDCSDEYQSYLPSIVDMVMQGASFAELSDRLMDVESYMLGDDHIRRRCDVIAVMVSHYGPHAKQNPFIATTNTSTPEAAYQTVLDSVTQTRLDAYQGKWSQVRIGYEQVVGLCRDHFADDHQLLGACLNNLGQAHSKIGNQEEALQMFTQALPKLAHRVKEDKYNYLTCLDNIINNLDHRRQFAATMPYYDLMLRVYIDQDGWDDGRTWEAKARQDAARDIRRPAPRLCPRRISVQQDGHGVIQQCFGIS